MSTAIWVATAIAAKKIHGRRGPFLMARKNPVRDKIAKGARRPTISGAS